MEIKVSIIMSVYNENKQELEESLTSILEQTFKDFEFIVVVDNPDNQELIELLKSKANKDTRLKILINSTNIGLANSLNRAIEISKGYYIGRMDADDIALPDRLQKQVYYLDKNQNISILGTNRVDIDIDGQIINENHSVVSDTEKINRILKYGSPICHPTVLFRRNIIDKIGVYRNFDAAQDYDFWLRAIQQDIQIFILEEKLLKYRIRENSISSSNPFKQFLFAEYGRYLFYEREINNVDSYSEINKKKYLETRGLYDDYKVKKFNSSFFEIQYLIKRLKRKKNVVTLLKIFRILFKSKELRKWFYVSIKYKRKLG